MPFLVKKGCSTRVRPDRACDEFHEYRPGMIVPAFPKWVPVDEWLASGHIARIEQSISSVRPASDAPSAEDRG